MGIVIYLLTVLKYINPKQIFLKQMQLYYVWLMYQKIFLPKNMKKTELYKYLRDFSVDYISIDVDDILDIHKHLMKKHDIK